MSLFFKLLKSEFLKETPRLESARDDEDVDPKYARHLPQPYPACCLSDPVTQTQNSCLPAPSLSTQHRTICSKPFHESTGKPQGMHAKK